MLNIHSYLAYASVAWVLRTRVELLTIPVQSALIFTVVT